MLLLLSRTRAYANMHTQTAQEWYHTRIHTLPKKQTHTQLKNCTHTDASHSHTHMQLENCITHGLRTIS